jgi:hypothetical protein
MGGSHHPNSVMAGLDPATQWPRVCAAVRLFARSNFNGFSESPARTDVRALGGRVRPGHDALEDAGVAS